MALAKASLLWEKLWPNLWPATALAGLFSAAALLNLFTYLPIWLHGVVVIMFLLAFSTALFKAFANLPTIRTIQSRHRIEQSSNLDHRPLTAIDDQLATGRDDPAAIALWRAHQDRMAKATEKLRLRAPQAGLAKRDPWGTRAAIAMMLVIGVVAAGADSFNRLGRALIPELNALGFTQPVNLSLWITPPAYTGEPPVIIHLGNDKAKRQIAPAKSLSVPAGSTLLAQVSGGDSLPKLKIDESELPFNRIEANAFHLETDLNNGNRLSIRQNNREIAAWPLTIVQDRTPVAEFTAAPNSSKQLRLGLPFSARDDYGITSVTASIRRLDGKAIPGGSDEIILRLPLPGQQKKQVKGKSNHDLITHVWAGLPVLVHLLATDEKGQTGLSAVEPVVLAERQFSHPAAKEIYEIRKGLTAEQRDRRLAILKLDQITDEPDKLESDSAIYLTLRIARERLQRDKREIAVAQVQKMLWDAALRMEEGRAATAGADLRAAQKKLMEAIERGASAKELDRLMAEVQRALNRFMSSLMKELQQRGQLSPLDPNAQTMTNQDLQRMLDRARELLRQGSRDAAKQLMAELQRMLENLRGAMARGGRMSEGAKQAQKSMRELRDIIRKQQKLLDQTHRQTQKGQPGGDQKQGEQGQENPEQGKQGLKEQEGIRKQLGKLMRKFGDMMGKIPKGLGKAERAMRESEQALGKGKPGQSINPQSRALEALRQGAQNSARAFARRMGRGRQNGRRGGRFGMFSGPRLRGLRPGNRDPFGRPEQQDGQQGTATGRVKIPGEAEMQRAREILKELRRRAGDLWRPELELEYIERLLKRF